MVAPFTSGRDSKPSQVLLSLAHSTAAISALGGELGIISPISQMRTLRSKEENDWRGGGISRLFIAINIYGAPTMAGTVLGAGNTKGSAADPFQGLSEARFLHRWSLATGRTCMDWSTILRICP